MCMMYLIGWRSNGLSEWVSDTSDKSVSLLSCEEIYNLIFMYLITLLILLPMRWR